MFDPLNFLKLAKKLAEKKDEASRRTSIGRAYYSAFLSARDKFKIVSKIPEVHREVTNKLYSIDIICGNKLHKLRRARNQSDYDMNIGIAGE